MEDLTPVTQDALLFETDPGIMRGPSLKEQHVQAILS